MFKITKQCLSAYQKRVMFLGAPGVGKGTYAGRAATELKIPTFSTGDLIRQQIKEGTEIGKELQKYTSKGKLVPDAVVIDMIKEKIKNEKGFILDGFPRTMEQAESLDKFCPLDLVLNLTQKDEILIQKIESRRNCQNCGKGYNLADIKLPKLHMPPILPKVEGICDDCGGKLIQREDDKLEVVQSRLNDYKKTTLPLVEYYTNKKILKDFPITGGVKQLLPDLIKLMEE
eukprot:gene11916-5321_t